VSVVCQSGRLSVALKSARAGRPNRGHSSTEERLDSSAYRSDYDRDANPLAGAMPMRVAWTKLLDAFEFISMSGEFGGSAWVSRETGAVFWHSDGLDELPEDIDDEDKYLELPSPRDLDLGKRLVMRFAADRLNDRYDEVAYIFSRSGAYRKFRALLERIGALEDWYIYEAEAKEKALREWCAENGVELEG
jgi:hypothetical protein